jgi:hypothetical protein
MPFPEAAQALGEDVHFLGDQSAVALTHRRGADELAAADVSEARLGNAHDRVVLRKFDAHALPVARLHGHVLTVQFLDYAADPHGRACRSLCEGGG